MMIYSVNLKINCRKIYFIFLYKKESITKETLAEKLFDYFDKKKGKETFDSLLKNTFPTLTQW